jgi:hypothetical protein
MQAHLTLSAGLVSTPFWASMLDVYSHIMSTISVTAGAVIGVATIVRWIIKNK